MVPNLLLPIFLKIKSRSALGMRLRRSSIVQEEELTNEGRHYLLLLHKQVHDKRGIAESLHVHVYILGLD